MTDDGKAAGTDGTGGGIRYRTGAGLGLCLPIGVALGISLGQLGGNPGMGVGLGAGCGVAIGAGIDAWKRRETAGPDEA
ncbi:hypothetical protein [Streptomyces sp. AC602_WCS936]|uniref:hypothetical protein n=1 Tax=Streptomyces sp. AC602_WCS936 TaxID=2823685 RepID=UPI001C277506|nr:hypothetical protein [Streptomyces sp. AC602_WCS936]